MSYLWHTVSSIFIETFKLLVTACGIYLVPWPGIEPGSTALGVRSISPWTIRDVPKQSNFNEWAKRWKRHFTKEDIWMSNKHRKGQYQLLATCKSKSQWDTTTPIKMFKIWVTMCWQRHRVTGTLLHCWWECRMCNYIGNSLEVP